jgi:hypothetical protein
MNYGSKKRKNIKGFCGKLNSAAYASFRYSRIVVGYHGTERSIADKIFTGGASLKASENAYDWLGHGIYFWEHGHERAREFTLEKLDRAGLHSPAVVGAYIQLGDCLDLLDTANTDLVAEAYERCQPRFQKIKNHKKLENGEWRLHNLDCAVINFTVAYLEKFHGRRIDSVRGLFQEGPPIYPGAAIRRQTHIQIAVRNPNCILGHFLPRIDSAPNLS